jgi:hypothetical protein
MDDADSLLAMPASEYGASDALSLSNSHQALSIASGQARHPVGCGFDFRPGAVRSLFAATRRAAASATRSHVTSSSGSSNSRSGAPKGEVYGAALLLIAE